MAPMGKKQIAARQLPDNFELEARNMSWIEQIKESEASSISPEKATTISAAFFREEILPRLQVLFTEAQRAGLLATLRVGEDLPREGSLPERAEIAVKRKVGERTVMAAELEIYCQSGFKYQAVTSTKEGRTNSLCFTVAGGPIQHLEISCNAFGVNIGTR